jgi:ankyrin repeat protein
VDICELLMRNNAIVDSAGRSGETPLFAACKANRSDVVKCLVGNGANLEHSLPGGFRPLHMAVLNDAKACVRFLLAAGANPWTLTSDGKRPIDLCHSSFGFELIFRNAGFAMWVSDR